MKCVDDEAYGKAGQPRRRGVTELGLATEARTSGRNATILITRRARSRDLAVREAPRLFAMFFLALC